MCLIALSLLTLFLSSTFAVSEEKSTFSKAQKAELDKLIRAYILEHPEILPQAMQVLQDRRMAQILNDLKEPLYNDGVSFVGGNKNGDVTIIEFFDYNCGYCKKIVPSVDKLLADDKNIKIIYKELPILAESSFTAAKAALAAKKQGKYEAFHRALMKNRGSLDEARIMEIAQNTGLDDAQLAIDMKNPEYDLAIQTNTRLAGALNIQGTPAFIIGNKLVPGVVPLQELKRLVKLARSKKK